LELETQDLLLGIHRITHLRLHNGAAIDYGSNAVGERLGRSRNHRPRKAGKKQKRTHGHDNNAEQHAYSPLNAEARPKPATFFTQSINRKNKKPAAPEDVRLVKRRFRL
jgi:hypothetical protein